MGVVRRFFERKSAKKSHRLFEDDRYVEADSTKSLLDESMWKKADALNDDDRYDGNIFEVNAPQVSEINETNSSPRQQGTEQDISHGETEKNVVDSAGGGIGDGAQTEPEQGERYPGYEQLRKPQLFPSERQRMGSQQMQKITVEEVARLSPRHAARMLANKINWVERDGFMKRLTSDLRRHAAIESDAALKAYTMRRAGVPLNLVVSRISVACQNGQFTCQERDAAQVMLHRMAERWMAGDVNVSLDEIRADANDYIERQAAKDLTTVGQTVKKAAKTVRSTDYTLYHTDYDAAVGKQINYADPLDVEWTLYRAKGDKFTKGEKLDVVRSPGAIITVAIDRGDGRYYVDGVSLLDKTCHGAYVVEVEKGIVTKYQSVAVDHNTGKKIDAALSVNSRKQYVEMVRSIKASFDRFAEQFKDVPYRGQINWALAKSAEVFADLHPDESLYATVDSPALQSKEAAFDLHNRIVQNALNSEIAAGGDEEYIGGAIKRGQLWSPSVNAFNWLWDEAAKLAKSAFNQRRPEADAAGLEPNDERWIASHIPSLAIYVLPYAQANANLYPPTKEPNREQGQIKAGV